MPKYYDPDTGKEVAAAPQSATPHYVDPDTGEAVGDEPTRNVALGTALAVVGKGLELGKSAISAAVHHPLDTAASLAAGKYVTPDVKALLNKIPGAETAKYLPGALKDMAGYAREGVSGFGAALSRGAGALAGAAEDGASALLPLVMAPSQLEQQRAIMQQLDAMKNRNKVS